MNNKTNKSMFESLNITNKLYFIGKYIFFGVVTWAYWGTMFSFARKSTSGGIVSFTLLILFFIYREIINPEKTNSNEFGKYTSIIGIAISIIVVSYLCFNVGFIFKISLNI